MKGGADRGNTTKYDRDRLERTAARYVISPKVFENFDAEIKRLIAEAERLEAEATALEEKRRESEAEARRKEAEGKRKHAEAEDVRLWLIIELNLDVEGGRQGTHDRIADQLENLAGRTPGFRMKPRGSSRHHLFAFMTRSEVQALVARDTAWAKRMKRAPAIFKVWPDRPLEPYLDRSLRIVKADACLRSFGSDGDGIVWAVADSGIQGDHPHFALYENLELPKVGLPPARSGRPSYNTPLEHVDFTDEANPLVDDFGHGTHVAGIIAGASPAVWEAAKGDRRPRVRPLGEPSPKVFRVLREKDSSDRVRNFVEACDKTLQGMAPKAKLVSLKVLNREGQGQESSLLSAIDYIAQVNDDGRWPRIHGLNLSLGYSFDAEWFAAGQSPLCVAVNRLVKQGVVVVAAAGNDGSALMATENSPSGRRVGIDQSITDPGNAEYAITVGSTHPEQPHTYGISYFSSRGPTADGRQKPDLVAPGERILSAASPGAIARLKNEDPRLRKSAEINDPTAAYYRQESGTSMAAPHVAGAVAAFLSVRREFIGQPERIKEILMASATDLKRRRDFQGAGLLDLLRAIQSV